MSLTVSGQSRHEVLGNLKQLIEEVGSDNSEMMKRLHSVFRELQDGNIISRDFVLKEYAQQSALSLIGFVGRMLRLRHPDLNVKMTIEQFHLDIHLTIECTEALYSEVEESLELYSLVLRGKKPMDALFSNENARMELKHILDMSVLQLSVAVGISEHAPNLKEATDFKFLEEEIHNLHHYIGERLSVLFDIRQMINELLEEQKERIEGALEKIRDSLDESTHAHFKDEHVTEAFQAVKSEEPDSYNRILETLNRLSASGHAGDTLNAWVMALMKSLPR